ncbi:MAG: rhodanese-like domain-containing protein [Crocinitomix sp.]|nr:rhodanese-like domain-containing protein [Crocinitomix sp.]
MIIEEINPKDVQAAIKRGSVFVDVREPYEIEEVSYGIEGHLQIPLGAIQTRMTEIPKDASVIIGCRSGARSMQACQFLGMNGYKNVKNLQGGIMSWTDNGLPTK